MTTPSRLTDAEQFRLIEKLEHWSRLEEWEADQTGDFINTTPELLAALRQLVADNARLRAALEPFAKIVPSSAFADGDNEAYSIRIGTYDGKSDFRRSDIERAKAALDEH